MIHSCFLQVLSWLLFTAHTVELPAQFSTFAKESHGETISYRAATRPDLPRGAPLPLQPGSCHAGGAEPGVAPRMTPLDELGRLSRRRCCVLGGRGSRSVPWTFAPVFRRHVAAACTSSLPSGALTTFSRAETQPPAQGRILEGWWHWRRRPCLTGSSACPAVARDWTCRAMWCEVSAELPAEGWHGLEGGGMLTSTPWCPSVRGDLRGLLWGIRRGCPTRCCPPCDRTFPIVQVSAGGGLKYPLYLEGSRFKPAFPHGSCCLCFSPEWGLV